MNVPLLFVPLLFAMLLPEGLELLERFRVFRLIQQVDGDRVPHASCVGFLQSLDDLFPHHEWKGERHLVVGRHSEYPVAVARQDHLRLPAPFSLDQHTGPPPALPGAPPPPWGSFPAWSFPALSPNPGPAWGSALEIPSPHAPPPHP